MSHKKPKWLNMGPIIVNFCFCGSEKAYLKAMRSMGIDNPSPFITEGFMAEVSAYEKLGENKTVLMCFDASNQTGASRNQIDSLIAHEAAHVAQHCIEYMNEKGEAKETFAYIVQYVFGFVTSELWGET